MNRAGSNVATMVAVLLLASGLIAVSANAADVKLLCSNNMKLVLNDVTAGFEQATGHKLVISLSNAGTLKKRVLAGEDADAVLVQRTIVDDLVKQGRILSESIRDVALSPMAVFVRTSAPKPPMGTVEEFKKLLLTAQSISYPDSSGGNLSGMFLADFFERLGMSEQLKGKTVLARNTAQTAEFVASGKADFGMSQLSELRAPGIDVVARFPKGIGGDIVISAAVIAGTKQSDAATALVRFLSSPTLAAAIKKHRLEPVTQ